MKILTCNSNRPIAEAISAYLNLPLTSASVRRFSDMEVFVEINENVRGEDVFVIQSTSYPANDNLMELLVTMDALRRGSARRITAVIPYFGYARQDRKSSPRSPISAKLVANLITEAGADRVLTLDLHAGQIQGFFDIPLDNLFASPGFSKDISEKYILAGETADTAVMFLPSESVYAGINVHLPNSITLGRHKRVFMAGPDNLMLLLHTVRAVLRDASMSEMAGAVQSEVSKMMDDVGRLDDRVSKLINHFTQAQSDLNAIQISSRKITSRGQKIEEIEVNQLPSIEK